jgi:hypothetical protein
VTCAEGATRNNGICSGGSGTGGTSGSGGAGIGGPLITGECGSTAARGQGCSTTSFTRPLSPSTKRAPKPPPPPPRSPSSRRIGSCRRVTEAHPVHADHPFTALPAPPREAVHGRAGRFKSPGLMAGWSFRVAGQGVRGPARSVGLGLSSPQQAKPFLMPADDRIRLDEEQGISPPRHAARQEHQQTSLMGTEGGTLDDDCSRHRLWRLAPSRSNPRCSALW